MFGRRKTLRTMAQAVRARIGACRLFLGSLAGSEGHAAASRTQQVALVAIVAETKSKLSVEELRELSELAAGIPWASEDLAGVLEAFLPPPPTQARQRSAMQDYTAFGEYFSEAEWVLLGDPAVSNARKRDLVIRRVTGLGGRTPGEPSVKRMTSFWLVCSESPAALEAMTAPQKVELLRFFKGTFKQWVRRLGHAQSFVPMLPSDPEEFRAAHPELFAACFPVDGPVPCKANLAVLSSFDASFGCRGGAKAPPVSLTVAQPGDNSALSQMERFANAIMSQQQQMMALLAHVVGGPQRPLRSLSALDNLQTEPLLGAIDAGAASAQGSPVATVGASQQRMAIAAFPASPAQAPPLALSPSGAAETPPRGQVGTPTQASEGIAAATPPRGQEVIRSPHLPGVALHIAGNNVEAGAPDGGDTESKGEGKLEAKGSVAATALAMKGAADLFSLIEDREREKRARKGSHPPKGTTATPKATPAKKAIAKTTPTQGQTAAAKGSEGCGPSFSMERSRSQVMCRTISGIASVGARAGRGSNCVDVLAGIVKKEKRIQNAKRKDTTSLDRLDGPSGWV